MSNDFTCSDSTYSNFINRLVTVDIRFTTLQKSVVLLTNGCDNRAGEEEGLPEAPRGDAGAVGGHVDASVVSVHDLRYQVIEGRV